MSQGRRKHARAWSMILGMHHAMRTLHTPRCPLEPPLTAQAEAMLPMLSNGAIDSDEIAFHLPMHCHASQVPSV